MPKNFQKIIEIYGLSESTSCAQIHQGTDNDAYLLTDNSGRKLVLREAKRSDGTKSLEFETKLLDSLSKSGFKSPAVIPTKSGELYTTIDGVSVTAFTFIDGYKYEQTNPEILSKHVIETNLVVDLKLHYEKLHPTVTFIPHPVSPL